MDISVAFSNKVHLTEYYHNSSWLEHGGAPDKAVRNAFVYQIDSYLKQNNKYNKTESKIKYDDVEDSLVCVISSFSSVSSYENQTKLKIRLRQKKSANRCLSISAAVKMLRKHDLT